MPDWADAAATVVPGHRVASGTGDDPRFPAGTIRPQLPFFAAAAPALFAHLGAPPFPGTVNLRLRCAVVPGTPDCRLPDIRWTDQLPAETFLLSRAWLEAGTGWQPMLLYIPDPLTKPDHHQPADVVELLGPLIAGLAYGATVKLRYPAAALRPAD